MTPADWQLVALGVALVFVLTGWVLVWDDKRRQGREWSAVFPRAPMTWREYASEKKNFITARLSGKNKTSNDKRRDYVKP